MLTKSEVSVLMKSVADVVQEYVGQSVSPLTSRMDQLDAQVKAIPAGKDGKDGQDADFNVLADAFVKGLQDDERRPD